MSNQASELRDLELRVAKLTRNSRIQTALLVCGMCAILLGASPMQESLQSNKGVIEELDALQENIDENFNKTEKQFSELYKSYQPTWELVQTHLGEFGDHLSVKKGKLHLLMPESKSNAHVSIECYAEDAHKKDTRLRILTPQAMYEFSTFMDDKHGILLRRHGDGHVYGRLTTAGWK